MHSLAAAFLLLLSVLIHIPNDAFGEGALHHYEKQIDGCIHESGVYYASGQRIYHKEKCQVWKCIVRPYQNEARFELQQSCPPVRPRPGCRLVKQQTTGFYPDCCPKLICEPIRKHPVVDRYKPTIFVDNIHPHIGRHYIEEYHQPVHHHSKHIGQQPHVVKSIDAYPYAQKTRYG